MVVKQANPAYQYIIHPNRPIRGLKRYYDTFIFDFALRYDITPQQLKIVQTTKPTTKNTTKPTTYHDLTQLFLQQLNRHGKPVKRYKK